MMDVTDQEVTDAIQTWNTTNKSNFYELSNWKKGCSLHEIIKIIKEGLTQRGRGYPIR